jgi:hypothetical protein
MFKIYAVGVISFKNDHSVLNDNRLWSLFKNFESAEKCVLENQGDIFECYYDRALIEEVPVIEDNDNSELYDIIPKQYWYEADFSDPDGVNYPIIKKIPAPLHANCMKRFWVG